MTNGTLDVLEVLRLVLDALDAAIESEQRRTGSVEGQRAGALAGAPASASTRSAWRRCERWASMVVGFPQQLREARYYLQVCIDRLSIVAFRDDLDVQTIVEALVAQREALGALVAEASA